MYFRVVILFSETTSYGHTDVSSIKQPVKMKVF